MRVSIVLLVSLIVAGCGTSGESTRVEGDPNAELHAYESDFRPSDYDPEPAPGSPASPNLLERPEGTPAEETPTLLLQEEVQGFRVQVYTTESIDSAKVQKAECESLFPGEWFYLDYDPPTYKIRAGNFLTKYEAYRFARRISDHGYPNAWPVPQRVYKDPPAPPARRP
jgi:hypothetical protein